ncbi:bifunctional diguanylate cyclase/phosphodiesterase [Pseudomonas sp. NPDC087612]|uniref:Diguanylate phosphodiesterase n=1 Tax=Pseudomonas vranovensis TaxID=321661 RepID=A0A423D4E3_9PSED|nr:MULTISPECIES: bifunctional diguanylate cyclase/phosphodiesterase [Pseudomonas]KJK19607.1 diguanylate phosphodiesterase [Pseudomonas sp. 2(2015)]QPG63202.1 EAL and GGDEF domain-containing protein [Pseudomonas sp. BIGb0427]QVM98025.1 EAL and GGDEF domain-containing protein [Pseudomonas sp. SORT22]ROL66435.1 diguanylate phosphodiesterase [Pseudomonas vranovensis]UVL55094.1 EAL and GGDEF domain-containing protein [Pseudomonas sp. B21-035]
MTINEQLSALSTILAQSGLHSLFQPIVCLSERRILGYEALSRGPSNSPLHSPINLFAVARQAGRLTELEVACRESACRRFSQQNLEGKLFLNVSPESLLEPQYQSGRTLKMLHELGVPPSRVVIELTEQTPTDDFQLLFNALHHYRDMGFSIALDDLGAGYSSLRLWSELRPDYVKIDRHFIDGIHLDAVKREFVGSILQIARASRAQVIAEGIELAEELKVLTEMGVDLVQGYLLGRPQEQAARDVQSMLGQPVQALQSLNEDSGNLAALLIEQPAVNREAPTPQVLELFRSQANLNSLAVLDAHGQPCGIVHRHSLSDALLKPFATDLFARKPISRLMSDDFLAVDLGQSLQQVSRLLTSRARQRIEEDFIITHNGRYLGLGRVIDVLKLITEQKIQQARYANPLTLLPGNVPIQQCLTRLLQQQRAAAICYVDIDSFKPFNDIYGYARGDEVLLCLAQCLGERVDPSRDFVGHIGGDDFMLVLGSDDWQQRLQLLLEDFHKQCRRFYRAEHLQAGCFIATDRQGRRQEFALLSLSIGVVQLHPQACAGLDAGQLAELASQAKHQAKDVPGHSLYLIDTAPGAQASSCSG